MIQGNQINAEEQFKKVLEAWYVKHGVTSEDLLFSHWVDATGPQTYRAGERIARELSNLTSLKDKKILDVGCGFGGAITVLAQNDAQCFGIDMNEEVLSLCSKRLSLHSVNVSVIRGNAFEMPFANEEFDIVVCTEMLEHIKNKSALISEISRVLKKGGIVYLAFPNFLSIRNVMNDPHYQLFGVTLMPLFLANWYTQKRRGRNYDVEILPIPFLITRLCRKNHMTVFSVNVSENILMQKIDYPESIGSKSARIVISALRLLKLHGLLKIAIRIKSNILPNGVLAGIKS